MASATADLRLPS